MMAIIKHRVTPCLLSVAVAVFCVAKALDAFGAAPGEGDRILADLSALKDELIGHKVTIVETVATIPDTHPLFEDLRARPEMRERLEAMMKKMPAGRTNTLTRTYSFQKDALWIETLESDRSGKLLHRDKVVATKANVFAFQAYLDVPDSVTRHANNLTGEVKGPNTRLLAGVPLWLSRGRLGEWLSDASIATCSRVSEPGGEDYFELTITNAPSSGAWSNVINRLLLRASDLTPVKMETYHPNRAVRFTSEIQFGDYGLGLLLCKKATTSTFNRNVLCEQNERGCGFAV